MLADALAFSTTYPGYVVNYFAYHLLSPQGLWDLVTAYLLVQGLWPLTPVLLFYALRFGRNLAFYRLLDKRAPLPVDPFYGPSSHRVRQRWIAIAISLLIALLFVRWTAAWSSIDDHTATIVIIRSIGDTSITAFYWIFLATYGTMRYIDGSRRRVLLKDGLQSLGPVYGRHWRTRVRHRMDCLRVQPIRSR
jgi:hypothetical protein